MPIFEGRKTGRDTGLTGSLRDFGLTDLFQVLGQQQKTGVLNLQEDKKTVQVFFDRGMIAGVAHPSENWEETALGRRLIRGGILSAENWKKAYKQHQTEGLSIEKVLVNSGMVTKEDLSAALRLLTIDTIYGLFKWRGGTFRFETKPVSYDSEFVEPLNAEYLLLDVLRMVDEWPMIAERIPTFDLVLQKTNPSATLDLLRGTPWEKSRTFQMEVIYDLIDGQRSVKQIIDLSFVEEFETCKTLITLLDAGLIQATSLRPKKEKGKIRTFQVTQHLVLAGSYFLVGIFTLFLLFQFMMTRLPNFPFLPGERQGWYIVRSSLNKIQEVRVKNAREVFFLEENRYPANPAEMVKIGLLNP